MAQVATGIDEVVKIIHHRKALFHMDSKEDFRLTRLENEIFESDVQLYHLQYVERLSWFVKSFVVKKLMESLET